MISKLMKLLLLIFLVVLLPACAKEEYIVTFNANGGTEIASISTDGKSIVEINEIPTREGYSFVGWYYDNDTFTNLFTKDAFLENPISSDLTLYAKWEVNCYKVSYAIVSGEFNNDEYYPLQAGESISKISMGGTHSTILTSRGRFLAWGDNHNGQLGDGRGYHHSEYVQTHFPVDITAFFNLDSPEELIDICAGGTHSAALTSRGRLFVWGFDGINPLPNTTPVDITSRFNLKNGEAIIKVSLGHTHSAALTNDGRLFTWGNNKYGQLGDGTKLDSNNPIDITKNFKLVSGEKIIHTSLAYYHSAAITSEGRVFTWGTNDDGQLGDGTNITKLLPTEITQHLNLNINEKPMQISIAYNYSAVVTSANRLLLWGNNNYGQLGDGTNINSHLPVDITNNFNLDADEKITEISLGSVYSSMLTTNGRVFTWGHNEHGQLGDGTRIDRKLPVEITNKFPLGLEHKIINLSSGSSHCAVLASDGELYLWGSSDHGRTGAIMSSGIDESSPSKMKFLLSKEINTEFVLYNEPISVYLPETEGYTFIGWYTDPHLKNPYQVSKMPSRNLSLYGRFIKN